LAKEHGLLMPCNLQPTAYLGFQYGNEEATPLKEKVMGSLPSNSHHINCLFRVQWSKHRLKI